MAISVYMLEPWEWDALHEAKEILATAIDTARSTHAKGVGLYDASKALAALDTIRTEAPK